jgi:hypothetical protein
MRHEVQRHIDLVQSLGVAVHDERLQFPVRGDARRAMLERAALLIANNTGPVHIAAALGTPVVDLYALTNPQHTPWGVRKAVLFEDVPCRFCYKSVCPMGHHKCLSLVAPEAVAAAAEQLLRTDAAPAGHLAPNARCAAIDRIDARPVTVP